MHEPAPLSPELHGHAWHAPRGDDDLPCIWNIGEGKLGLLLAKVRKLPQQQHRDIYITIDGHNKPPEPIYYALENIVLTEPEQLQPSTPEKQVTALVREALALLDGSGLSSSAAACDLQSALHHLGAEVTTIDVQRLEGKLLAPDQRSVGVTAWDPAVHTSRAAPK